MERREQAVALKHSGYNCCQAVLAAYGDVLEVPEELLKKMGAGFGVGMGSMEATCGALVGAEMVLGLLEYQDKPILARAKQLQADFLSRTGAGICKVIKGVETGEVLCPCDDCVRNAVDALDRMMEE